MIGRSNYLVFRQSFENRSIIYIRKFGMDHKKVGKGKGSNNSRRMHAKISLDSSKVEIIFVIVFERK